MLYQLLLVEEQQFIQQVEPLLLEIVISLILWTLIAFSTFFFKVASLRFRVSRLSPMLDIKKKNGSVNMYVIRIQDCRMLATPKQIHLQIVLLCIVENFQTLFDIF